MSRLANRAAVAGATDGTERFTKFVGLVSAGAGGALVAAPARVGPVMALTDPRATRLIGVADLLWCPGWSSYVPCGRGWPDPRS